MITDFCIICGTKENLQNHHIIPIEWGGSDDKTNLITLCGEHHAWIHSLRPTTWNNHSNLIKEGIKRVRQKGKVWGRPSNLTPIIEKRILELRSQGMGLNKISIEVKVGVRKIRKIIGRLSQEIP